MKNPFAVFSAILVFLAGVSLALSSQAFHRGEVTASFVLLVIAVIFWKRVEAHRF